VCCCTNATKLDLIRKALSFTANNLTPEMAVRLADAFWLTEDPSTPKAPASRTHSIRFAR
jgi:hypothetical protein